MQTNIHRINQFISIRNGLYWNSAVDFAILSIRLFTLNPVYYSIPFVECRGVKTAGSSIRCAPIVFRNCIVVSRTPLFALEACSARTPSQWVRHFCDLCDTENNALRFDSFVCRKTDTASGLEKRPWQWKLSVIIKQHEQKQWIRWVAYESFIAVLHYTIKTKAEQTVASCEAYNCSSLNYPK